MTCDQLLDLAERLAVRGGEPGGLGVGDRDARQLAHRGERQLAGRQLDARRRQADQRAGDAHPLARGVGAEAQHALHVLVVVRAAEVEVEADVLGAHEIEGLGGIERAALAGVVPQPAIELEPRHRRVVRNVAGVIDRGGAVEQHARRIAREFRAPWRAFSDEKRTSRMCEPIAHRERRQRAHEALWREIRSRFARPASTQR